MNSTACFTETTENWKFTKEKKFICPSNRMGIRDIPHSLVNQCICQLIAGIISSHMNNTILLNVLNTVTESKPARFCIHDSTHLLE